MKRQNILITGGLGYVGSHIAVNLLNIGHNVTIVDNCSTSKIGTLYNIIKIAGKNPIYYNFDINNTERLTSVLKDNRIDTVIHCAGLKSVQESIENNLKYFYSIYINSHNVIDAMKLAKVNNIIFSSSATVYGPEAEYPIREKSELKPNNPYAQYKLQVEQLLRKTSVEVPKFKAVVFRFFNILGAHESGLIGDFGQEGYSNVMKNISDVYIGKEPVFKIAGNDRKTHDGTGMRDYIHVNDIADAHSQAIKYLHTLDNYTVLNLGNGRAFSVLSVLKGFQHACGQEIPHTFVPRREGDVDVSYSDNTQARQTIYFSPKRSLDDMCSSHFNFVVKNTPELMQGKNSVK